MNRRKLMALGILGGIVNPYAQYTLFDDFAIDLASGSINGTLATDGVNVRIVADIENKLSISGGASIWAGKTTPSWGDPRIDYASILMITGRTLEMRIMQTSNVVYSGRVGFRDNSQVFSIYSYVGLGSSSFTAKPAYQTTPRTVNKWYSLRIVTTSEFLFYFIKGEEYTSWYLFGIDRKDEPTTATFSVSNNNALFSLDYVSIYDSDFSDLGNYTSYINNTPWSQIGSADGWDIFTWIPQTNEVLDFSVRQSDATHRIICRCSQSGSTVKLIRDNGGETELHSVAQTFTANSRYLVVVYKNGSILRTYVNDVTAAIATDTFNQTVTSVAIAGFTKGRDLISYPLTYSDSYISQTSKISPKNILAIGTSKSLSNYGTGVPDYLQFFTRLTKSKETPTRIAAGGRTTATLKSIIDAQLAAAVGTPDYICYEMGRNEAGTVTKANWESDTNYILDALHAKYPLAQIYISRLWYRGGSAFYTDFNAIWIPDVIVGRPYCHLGSDETICLENGDDGASRAPDGTHTNWEGAIQWAKNWKSAMGL